jgi:CheY-like chemotaxis protein/Tfp pilus assembly protein PilZ
MSRSHIAIGGLDITAEPFQQLTERFDWDLSLIEELDGERVAPGDAPRCLVVDWEYDDSREQCRDLRAAGTLPDVPVVAVVDDPWSPQVADAFASGVDDFLPRRQLDRVEQKVAAVAGGGALLGQSASGQVVLVDPDRDQRVQLARQLRRMGFDVHFALDVESIPQGDQVKMVVLSAGLDVSTALAQRSDQRPWLIAGSREQLDAIDMSDAKRTKLFDTSGDPGQIVFVANQLLTEEFTQLRASKRLVYGVPIHFGGVQNGSAGTRTFGYTYNISLGGLFVRTLTPPAMGTVLDLSFTPPAGRGRVLVTGQVVWRQEQPVGRNGVPCGFGLQYADELPLADGAALETGYQALAEQLESLG